MTIHFESFVKRNIGRRDWEQIRSRWAEHIPNKPPGSPPIESLGDQLETGHSELTNRILAGADATYDSVSGLKSAVFSESIFLLHKAVHVLGVAETNVKSGISTWSLSNSYQSSFFSTLALLGFLGVAVARVKNDYILMDLWPEQVRQKNQRRRKIDANEDIIRFIKIKSVGHKEIWSLFQRVVRASSLACWPQNFLGLVRNIPTKNIPRQRNMLHYQNHKWIYSDLHQWKIEPAFGTAIDSIENFAEDSDFSFVFAASLLRILMIHLESLTEITEKLEGEINLIRTAYMSPKHELQSHLQIE